MTALATTTDAFTALAADKGLSSSRDAVALLADFAGQQREGATIPPKVATLSMRIAAAPGLGLEDQLAVYGAMEDLFGKGSQYGKVAADRASALRARRYVANRADEQATFAVTLAGVDDAKALQALARQRRDAGDAEQQILVLRRVLELDRTGDALVALATTLLDGGEMKESGVLLEEALAGAVSIDADGRRRAQIAQMAWQRAAGSTVPLRKAQRTGKALLAAHPDDVAVLRAYAAVQIDLGELPEAEAMLAHAGELTPPTKADGRELRRLSARYRDAGDETSADRVVHTLD